MSKLNKLPVNQDLNSYDILKQLIKTHQALAELKGFSGVIPNKYILINAAMINEAKNSSEIENIVTTHDEIYKAMSLNNSNKEAKEVVNYKEALWYGYQFIKENEYLSLNAIIRIQNIIESNDAGIRKTFGMVLRNMKTGGVVYEPPGSFDEIMELLNNLETYINEKDDLDELIRMAIIHYQFESIHPFYDGNGRTGLNPNDDAPYFMGLNLTEGYLEESSGVFIEPKCYSVNFEKLDEYDKEFPQKKKEKLPGQFE